MPSKLAIKAGRKLFEKHLQNYTPVDPLYETYIDKKGRERRRKRELPPGLSKRDAKILQSVKRRAHYLDKGFNLCGMRFGWAFIIGIIPVVGDAADAALNYLLVIRKARQAELPHWLVQRMLFNNVVSVSVGIIPIVGDIVLAAYKANSRNAALLEEYLRVRGEEFLKREQDRLESPGNVKPGAGREPGEHVLGESSQGGGSGWFKWSNKKTPKQDKGKAVDTSSASPPPAVIGGRRNSRFIEDLPSD